MADTKKVAFKAETRQVLDIVINSLYSNREIFMRELVSNASDALDKRRFLSITDKKLQESDLSIKLVVDEKAKTLTFIDNGIGMTEEEVVDNLGTIARSGTKEFLKDLKEAEKTENPELIGQFGVGFYSSFMVADSVTVKTLKAGTDKAVLWQSSGDGSYNLSESDKKNPGTEITLHLKEVNSEDGDKDYTKEWVLKELVKKYSDFITYPVKMDISREETPKDKDGKEIEGGEKEVVITEETLNSMKAIWTRPKSDVKDEEYNEFYKQISHDFTDPMERIAFSAEGTFEYKALLYIPSKRPMDIMYRDGKRGLSLYVKQIFIMGDCEKILPEYLRFMKGIVDSSDLPLNISREMIQEDRHIEAIKKRLTKKVLDTLKTMMSKNRDGYVEFWKEFGEVIKEGPVTDFANADEIKDLLLFPTSQSETLSSLDEYISRMPESQTEIFYVTGDSIAAVKNSPLLEVFSEKGYEVLYLTDKVDEFMSQSLTEYKEKKFKSVNKGDVDLQSDEEKKESKKENKQNEKKFSNILTSMQKNLDDHIKEVRLSNRLKKSAVCLVTAENEMTAQMEQMMRGMGQEVPKSKKILEINPKHPVIDVLKSLNEDKAGFDRFNSYTGLLYKQALLAEGLPIEDPVEFSQKIADLMVDAQKN